MNIVNSTKMDTAEIIIATDKEGVEHYLLVIKGTFDIIIYERLFSCFVGWAAPLVYADEYYGDPAILQYQRSL